MNDNNTARKEYFDAFYKNIKLLWENRDYIRGNFKFANIRFPIVLYGTMYSDAGDTRPTIDELFKIWKTDEKYAHKCSNCDETAYLYHFAFSPLSGNIFIHDYICPSCGKEQKHYPKVSPARSLVHPITKETKKDIAHIYDLLIELGEKQYKNKPRDTYSKRGQGFVKVGNASFSFGEN